MQGCASPGQSMRESRRAPLGRHRPRLRPQPVRALTHVLAGAMDEAVLSIAYAMSLTGFAPILPLWQEPWPEGEHSESNG
jgi:hypothetical protein